MAPPVQPDIAAGRLPAERLACNFADAHPPLDPVQVEAEASRCYYCYDAPCIEACPTGIDIPGFIAKIAAGNPKGAARDILSANIMGGMCARVCPTEVLCEEACVRNAAGHGPVQIGQLQRHATDWLFERGIQLFERGAATGKRVAVVGGGPAGLACAHRLATLGHEAVVFEARAKLAGLNEYGIAAYKTPGGFAQAEADYILGVGGITVRTGTALGRDITLDQLRREFDAVFLGVGLGGVNQLGVPGENLGGVIDAVAYIERLRQADDLAELPVGRRIVVIGGGNTAIDIAVQTKRLGAEDVTLTYRRGPEAMSATAEEQAFAQLNGVRIKHWVRPARLIGKDGQVTGIDLEYTRLDGDGRLVGTGETLALAADMVFKAIGQTLAEAALPETRGGKIVVDADGRTSLAGVWAGGDCTKGIDLTVQAVQDGKTAADAIDRALRADGIDRTLRANGRA